MAVKAGSVMGWGGVAEQNSDHCAGLRSEFGVWGLIYCACLAAFELIGFVGKKGMPGKQATSCATLVAGAEMLGTHTGGTKGENAELEKLIQVMGCRVSKVSWNRMSDRRAKDIRC